MIFCGQLGRGFVEQVCRIRADYVALLLVGLDQKWIVLRLAVVFHRVEQIERVLGPQVERISPECLLDLRAAGFHLAQAK